MNIADELGRRLDTIAPDLRDSLDQYGSERIETGGFLRACLENDFMEACGRADHINQRRLWLVADWIYNELPSNCWGSKEIVQKWIDGREQMLKDRAELAALYSDTSEGSPS